MRRAQNKHREAPRECEIRDGICRAVSRKGSGSSGDLMTQAYTRLLYNHDVESQLVCRYVHVGEDERVAEVCGVVCNICAFVL